MIDAAQIRFFLPAAAILAVLPGPGMLYVLARSLRGGRREGLASSFGTAAGGMIHVVAGAFGLSAILFFLAFIPQFIHHTTPLLIQFLTLGSISVALNTLADILIVLAAVPLARRLNSSPLWLRRQRQASGAALIGLGGYVALSSES